MSLPKPIPQILFYGGTIGFLSSLVSFRYFGDLTMGLAPNEEFGWNASTNCSVPNAWLLTPDGTCQSGYFAKYYDRNDAQSTVTWSWDLTQESNRSLLMAAFELGNGGVPVWGSQLSGLNCATDTAIAPWGCWALVPFEIAILAGIATGGYKL